MIKFPDADHAGYSMEELDKAWEAFDRKTRRLQTRLLGRAIMRTDSCLKRRMLRHFGPEFGLNEQDQELVGAQFLDFGLTLRDRRSRRIETLVDKAQRALDRMEDRAPSRFSDSVWQLGLVPQEAWLEFIRVIMRSQMSGGWYWRSLLDDAFGMLEDGSTPALFHQRRKYVHGGGAERTEAMRLAVLHVYYAAGSQWTVDRHKRAVANELGVGFETLKTWGDQLRRSPAGKADIRAARLAGEIGVHFGTATPAELLANGKCPEDADLDVLKRAKDIHFQLSGIPVSRLRDLLRRVRTKLSRAESR